MATLEQVIYGTDVDGQVGRGVLARSPGVIDDCAQEVVRLCEGWGAVPDDGLRRPVLMSFPIESRLPALPGELYAVVRISQGLKPVYHALIINDRDFQDFDHNPFVLTQEGVFLDSWTLGHELPRRTMTATSFAPLVSPPPSIADVGNVDEAVRQMLANERLLLPLESSTGDSDRFLALVVAGLPRSLRKRLRLASWAPSGANRYFLAATYRESANFAAWQPFLMTSILGKLDESADEYLSELRRCLEAGDLAGIEKQSRESGVGTGRNLARTPRTPERTLSATVDAAVSRKLASRVAEHRTQPTKKRKQAPVRAATATTGGKNRTRMDRSTPRRSRPRPKLASGGSARRGFAVMLSLCIMGAGAYYMWTAGHWTRLPGLSSVTGALNARAEHGVVDVGAVYLAALGGVQESATSGAASHDLNSRRRGLDLLDEAGQLLEVQGRNFLLAGEQTLSGDVRKGLRPAPADRLRERGRVLTRELRRLAMARVSLRDHSDWRDLAELDSRALSARYDSLVSRRRIPGVEEPDLTAIDQLLRQLDVTTRQIVGLAALEDLFDRKHWNAGWSADVRSAVDALGAVRQGRARTMRDDAEVLARLKQAEHASDLAARAYRQPYDDGRAFTAPVADVLPALYRRIEARGPSSVPTLLAATCDLYRGLDELSNGTADVERLAGLVPALDQNHAARFDPVAYGDHLARLRFLHFQRLVTERADPADLAEVMGGDDAAAENLLFLRGLSRELDAAGWRELADQCEDPFLVRWAVREAVRLDATRRERRQEFLTAHAALLEQRETLFRLASTGSRCGEQWCELLEQARAVVRLTPDDLDATREQVGSLADRLTTPPPLAVSGFTVRLDQDLLDVPRNLLVEAQTADAVTRVTSPLVAGPAAPVGSGWVGATSVVWDLPLIHDQHMTLLVRDADSGQVLATYDGRWLTQWEPADLTVLDNGAGVRLSCRLENDFWGDVSLPALDDIR